MFSKKFRSLTPKWVKLTFRYLYAIWLFNSITDIWVYLKIKLNFENETQKLKIRLLGGEAFSIRPYSTDLEVVFSTFMHKFHIPPIELDRNKPTIILDLGANIGATMAHLAYILPNAKIIGVEMDKDNFDMATNNLQPWSRQTTLIHCAIWHQEETLSYVKNQNKKSQDAFALGTNINTLRTGESVVEISTHTIDGIISKYLANSYVDFVKMDIEGAEKEVMRHNTNWLAFVKTIKIEVHGDYSVKDAVKDLENCEFAAFADPNHHAAVIGINKSLFTNPQPSFKAT